MIDKLILSAIFGIVGFNGLFPDTPQSLMPWQLQQKAKEKSITDMCNRKPKGKEAKDLCRRWRKHNA